MNSSGFSTVNPANGEEIGRPMSQDCPRFGHRWSLHQWHHGIGSSGPRWRSEEQRLRQRAFSLRSTCIRKRPNCMD